MRLVTKRAHSTLTAELKLKLRLLMRHTHTHAHSYTGFMKNISKLLNHTHFRAQDEDVCIQEASEEPQSGSNETQTHNCKHTV